MEGAFIAVIAMLATVFLSISGPSMRFTPQVMESYGPLVREAAMAVSLQLGHDSGQARRPGSSVAGVAQVSNE